MATYYTGAVIVLQNYLEGAIADYKKGNLQVEHTFVICDCVRALKKLNARCYEEYFDRVRNIMEEYQEIK